MDSFPAFSTSPSVVSSVLQGMNSRSSASGRVVNSSMASNASMTPNQNNGLFTTGNMNNNNNNNNNSNNSNSAFDVFSTSTSNGGFSGSNFVRNTNNTNNNIDSTNNNNTLVINNSGNNSNNNNNNTMMSVAGSNIGMSPASNNSNNNLFGVFSNTVGIGGNNNNVNNNSSSSNNNNGNHMNSSPLLSQTPMMFSTSANVNNYANIGPTGAIPTTGSNNSSNNNNNNLMSGVGNHMNANFSTASNMLGGNMNVAISNSSLFSNNANATTNNNNGVMMNNSQVGNGLAGNMNSSPNTFSTSVNNFGTGGNMNHNNNNSMSMSSFNNTGGPFSMTSNNNNNNNNNNVSNVNSSLFGTRMSYSAMPSSAMSPPSFSTSAFPHLPPSSMISSSSSSSPPGPAAMMGINNIHSTSPPHQLPPMSSSMPTTINTNPSSSSTTPNPVLPITSNTGNGSGTMPMSNVLPLGSTQTHSDHVLGQYQENYNSPLQSQPSSMFNFQMSQQTPQGINSNNNNINSDSSNNNRFDFPVDGRNQMNAFNTFNEMNGMVYNDNSRNKFSNGGNNNNFSNTNYQFNANVLGNNQVMMMSNNSNNNNNTNSFTNYNASNDSNIGMKQDYTQNSNNNSNNNNNQNTNTSIVKMGNGEIDTTCQDITNLPNTDEAGVLKYANKHLTSTFDIGANDLQSLEQLKEMIMALQDAADGKVNVNWTEMINFSNIPESASAVCSALTSIDAQELQEAYDAIAHLLKRPEHISLLVALEERHRIAIRNVLLQHLFNKLLLVSNSTPRPVCAEMLVKMAQLHLVRLQGIAATVNQLLPKVDKQRAGIAVLGRVAEQFQHSEPFVQMLRAEPVILETLRQLAMQPEFEYDVLAIYKLLHCTQELNAMISTENCNGVDVENENAMHEANQNDHLAQNSNDNDTIHETTRNSVHSANKLILFSTIVHKVSFPAPALSIDYMSSIDELVSCHANGDVVMWGSPTIASYMQNNNNNNGESSNSTVAIELCPEDVFTANAGDYTSNDESNRNQSNNNNSSNSNSSIRCIPTLISSAPCNGNYFVSTHTPMNEQGLVCANRNSSSLQQLQNHISITTNNNNSNPVSCKAQPFFCIHTYNTDGVRESTTPLTWSRKFIPRPRENVITALTTWENNLFCTAEYGPKENNELSHQLHFYSAETCNELRCIEDVHNDYVTVLSRCDDSEHVLISGGRDAVVKLWDCRSRSSVTISSSLESGRNTFMNNDSMTSCAVVHDSAESSLLYKLDGATHVDTISCIHSFRSHYICTASLDGSMQMWDTRNLSLSVCTRRFNAPVLDITTLVQNSITSANTFHDQETSLVNKSTHILASTARGLYLLDTDTLIARDIIPNVAFNQLRVNKSGDVLFANDGSTGVINVFTFRKM